jgi:GDPmannose 4,6-dehydratase
MKTAIVTGVCGQSGSYLAKHLLSQGYNVIGWARRNASLAGLKYLGVDIKVVDIDICDPHHVSDEIYKTQPQELYNLAAQSHVGLSFNNAMQTCAVNYGGYLNILLAARKLVPSCKIYQAGTSEMFGYSSEGICNETTPFAPMSPYAISKVAAHWAGVNARYEAEQFVCNGILFNHESPLRGNDFVTKKITNFVKTFTGVECLRLGNLDSSRDWGHAKDYVVAMHKMLQADMPDDYVIATGRTTTVRNFVRLAFQVIGKDIEFEGEGVDERGYINGVKVIEVSPEFYRPNDLKYLKGNAKKAQQRLNWTPEITIEQLVEEMVRA